MKSGDPVYRPIRSSSVARGARTAQWWIVCGKLQVRSFERLDRAATILVFPRADVRVLPERKWPSFDGLWHLLSCLAVSG